MFPVVLAAADSTLGRSKACCHSTSRVVEEDAGASSSQYCALVVALEWCIMVPGITAALGVVRARRTFVAPR